MPSGSQKPQREAYNRLPVFFIKQITPFKRLNM